MRNFIILWAKLMYIFVKKVDSKKIYKSGVRNIAKPFTAIIELQALVPS